METNINNSLHSLGVSELLILILILIFAVALLAIPFLYLNTLSRCIKTTNPTKRTINPQSVWLYLIPIVGIFIHYNHIKRINETLDSELSERGVNRANYRGGLNAGKTFSILGIISFFMNVCYFIYYLFSVSGINNNDEFLYDNVYNETYLETFGPEPTIIFGLIYLILFIISLICWIIYWSKISYCKNVLLNYNNQSGHGSKNDYTSVKAIHQTKICPDCKSEANIDDSFCMKCGFDFIKHEKLLREKLKENEKECPECELIQDKSIKTCTNCGFPFPSDSIQIKKGQVIIERNNANKEVSENNNSSSIINENSPVETNNEVEQIQKSNNSSLFIILGIILFLIAILVVYKFAFSGPSAEELEAIERAKSDSIAAAEAAYADSIAIAEAYSAERENAERENEVNDNQFSSNLDQEEIASKIQKYYAGLQNGYIDANDFFSSNVIQYYTKTHLTPNDINELNNSGNQEFSNPEFTFNDGVYYSHSENEIVFYTINYHYKCFRVSKQKFEECDVQAEIGINSNYEFVSLKEIKIDNLKFYDKEFSNNKVDRKKNSSTNEVFTVVEEMPEFPGGMRELTKFIQNNIIYPQAEQEAGIQGKVFIRFIVNIDGSISNIDVLRGVAGGEGLSREAKRIIKSMPKWKPGRQNGSSVPVFFNLPINFTLN